MISVIHPWELSCWATGWANSKKRSHNLFFSCSMISLVVVKGNCDRCKKITIQISSECQSGRIRLKLAATKAVGGWMEISGDRTSVILSLMVIWGELWQKLDFGHIEAKNLLIGLG